jgi:hypothetical protein
MEKLLIMFLFLSFLGCDTKEKIHKLSAAEAAKRAADWAAAVPVMSSAQIVGRWAANAVDMPDGSTVVEWKRSFKKDGDLTESIAIGNEATGPILTYKVERSRLYVSDSPELSEKDQGELRLKNGNLLIKTKEGIYIFHHVKS